MSHMVSLLKEMRGRLGMFIGTPSLSRLAAFLRGYDLAMQKSGLGADPFLPSFRDWVHKRLHTTSLSWEDAILEESAGEADAVKQFWKLLDKFLHESVKGRHFIKTATNKKRVKASPPKFKVGDMVSSEVDLTAETTIGRR